MQANLQLKKNLKKQLSQRIDLNMALVSGVDSDIWGKKRYVDQCLIHNCIEWYGNSSYPLKVAILYPQKLNDI